MYNNKFTNYVVNIDIYDSYEELSRAPLCARVELDITSENATAKTLRRFGDLERSNVGRSRRRISKIIP